jgi:hypothetical protein
MDRSNQILVACEFTGEVRDALNALGYDAEGLEHTYLFHKDAIYLVSARPEPDNKPPPDQL